MAKKHKGHCAICTQPLTKIVVGPKKYEMWVHRGSQLDTCKAIRLRYNFAKTLLKRMEEFKVKFGMKFIDGHVMMHGENRAKNGRRKIS